MHQRTLCGRVREVVESGVHQQTTEKVRPSQVVDSIRFARDGAASYFCVEVLVQDILELRLDRKRFV